MSPTVRDGRGKRETFEIDLGGSGAGPVVRRQAGADERGGFAPRVVSPGLPAARRPPARVARADDLTPPQRELVTQLVNADRSERGVPLIRLADPPVTPEDPVMAIEPPPPDTFPDAPPAPALDETADFTERLDRLARRSASAVQAWEAKVAADVVAVDATRVWIDAQQRLVDALGEVGLQPLPPRVPLEDRVGTAMALGVAAGRLHSVDGVGDAGRLVVAAIDRAEGDLAAYAAPSSIGEVLDRRAGRERAGTAAEAAGDAPEDEVPPAGDAGITRLSGRAEADRIAAGDLDAERATKAEQAAGGGPGPRRPSTKQDRILDAVTRLGGDIRAIADAEGTTPGNVTATLHNAGKRSRLTIEMQAVLPASFAKYPAAR